MHNAEFANEHSPGQLSNQDETQALPTMNLFYGRASEAVVQGP